MASDRLVHTKRISPREIRELYVYYDKGGINYFDYSTKPKGIFFSSTVYEQEEGSIWRTLKVGLGRASPAWATSALSPLDRYRPKALKEVRQRVESHADRIHALCAVGDAEALEELKAILTGETVPQTGEVPA